MGQEIIPAILPDDFETLQARLGEVASLARTVHIDACDGVFVPRVSWPYGDTDPGQHFASILKEEEGLPFWEKFDFEAHLMLVQPEKRVEDWVRAGASRVIVQAEAIKDKNELFLHIGNLTELGICLKLETPLDAFMPYMHVARTLHLMSIARIGYQGEGFQEAIFDRIKNARAMFPHVSISIDGGVSVETADKLLDAGADRLIVGSALFGSEDVTSMFRDLEAITR